MPKSVKLLEDAKSTVKGNPILDGDMEVVSVLEKGTDWIRRDFDPTSVKLKGALSDPQVSEARNRLIKELSGKSDEISKNLHKKLTKNPPSANLHWSPTKGKILVIDMM